MGIFVHAQHPTFMDRVVGSPFLQNAVGFPIEGASRRDMVSEDNPPAVPDLTELMLVQQPFPYERLPELRVPVGKTHVGDCM